MKDVLADYYHAGNPLFVPEAQFRTGDIFWALGQHRTIGYSAFAIEDGGQTASWPAVIKLGGYTITAQETMGLLGQMLLDVVLQAPPPRQPLPSEIEGPRDRGTACPACP